MPVWLLATTLLVAPAGDEWSPATNPPPTPWAMAGARGWRLCQEAERRARAAHDDNRTRGTRAEEEGQWARRARQCPHAVHVLLEAAQEEVTATKTLLKDLDLGGDAEDHAIQIQRLVEEHRERLEQALGWLDAAIAESGRRGQRPPRETLYYRAYALTTLGRIPEARTALREVREQGDVQRWRIERMAALVELFAGDIEEALRRAHRGVYDAPAEDRIISRYIRALVLDRAGASAVAKAEIRALSAISGAELSLPVTESVLPVHERLFLRALVDQARGLQSPALRYWQAYLLRPEPEEPERVLARRHLDELTPSPMPAGGP